MIDLGTEVNSGEFAGWQQLRSVRFNEHTGPFYHRYKNEDVVQCVFRTDDKNLNSDGIVHGGSLLTFADYCLYVTSLRHVNGPVVTISLTSDFTGVVRSGDLVEAVGKVVSSGRSLIFASGNCMVGQKNVLSFSGIFKRLRGKSL